MTDLITAIKEAADWLAEGETPETVISEIASEYEINPILLARKFREQHKVAITDYAKTVVSREAAIEVARKAAIEKAKMRAREIADFNIRWNDPSRRALVGRLFKHDGREYALVARVWERGQPRVIAVNVENGKTMNLSKKAFQPAGL